MVGDKLANLLLELAACILQKKCWTLGYVSEECKKCVSLKNKVLMQELLKM